MADKWNKQKMAIAGILDLMPQTEEECAELLEILEGDGQMNQYFNELRHALETAKIRAAAKERQKPEKSVSNAENFVEFLKDAEEAAEFTKLVEENGQVWLQLNMFEQATPTDQPMTLASAREKVHRLNAALGSSVVVVKWQICQLVQEMQTIREKLFRPCKTKMQFIDWLSKNNLLPKDLTQEKLNKYSTFAYFVNTYKRFLLVPISYSRIMKWMSQLKKYLAKPRNKMQAEFWKNDSDCRMYVASLFQKQVRHEMTRPVLDGVEEDMFDAMDVDEETVDDLGEVASPPMTPATQTAAELAQLQIGSAASTATSSSTATAPTVASASKAKAKEKRRSGDDSNMHL